MMATPIQEVLKSREVLCPLLTSPHLTALSQPVPPLTDPIILVHQNQKPKTILAASLFFSLTSNV